MAAVRQVIDKEAVVNLTNVCRTGITACCSRRLCRIEKCCKLKSKSTHIFVIQYFITIWHVSMEILRSKIHLPYLSATTQPVSSIGIFGCLWNEGGGTLESQIQIQIHKYKYKNTNTQIQIHKYKYINKNT